MNVNDLNRLQNDLVANGLLDPEPGLGDFLIKSATLAAALAVEEATLHVMAGVAYNCSRGSLSSPSFEAFECPSNSLKISMALAQLALLAGEKVANHTQLLDRIPFLRDRVVRPLNAPMKFFANSTALFIESVRERLRS